MTSIVAIKKTIQGEPVVYVGWDSQISEDGEKIRHSNVSKMIKFPNFVVLGAGDARVFQVLSILSIQGSFLRKPFMKIKDIKDVIAFANATHSEIKDHIGPALLDDQANVTLILATTETIYQIDPYLFVFESKDFLTAGSGKPFMSGLLSYLYKLAETESDLKNMVDFSLEVAYDLDSGTSEPLHCMKVSKSVLPKEPEKKKRGPRKPKESD